MAGMMRRRDNPGLRQALHSLELKRLAEAARSAAERMAAISEQLADEWIAGVEFDQRVRIPAAGQGRRRNRKRGARE